MIEDLNYVVYVGIHFREILVMQWIQKRNFIYQTIFITMLLITSCQNKSKEYLVENENLDTKKIVAIKTGQVVNGMTEDEVKITLGEPTFVENNENLTRWVYRLVEKGKNLADVYTPQSAFPQGIIFVIPFYYRPREIKVDFCNKTVCKVEEILSF